MRNTAAALLVVALFASPALARTPIPTPSPTPKPTATATPVASGQPSFAVVNYGAKCDDVTDDTAAFANAFTAAKAGCQLDGFTAAGQAVVDFPPGKICKLNSGLSIDAGCVGLRGNGATLDFTGLASGHAAISTYDDAPVNPYGMNVTFQDLHIIGPGQSTSSNTVGVLSGSTGTTYISPSISGFDYGFEVGNYSWILSLINPQLFANGTGFYCPSGTADSGENESIIGGAIYNSAVGLEVDGCQVNSTNTSYDYETADIANINGGQLRLTNSHIEFNSLTGALFNLYGVNSWAHFIAEGGDWTCVTSDNPCDLATVNATGINGDGGWGPWAQIDNVFMVGLNPSAACAYTNSINNPYTCTIGQGAYQVKYLLDREKQGNIMSSKPINSGDVLVK